MTQAVLNQNNLDLLTTSQTAVCEKVSVVKNNLDNSTSSKTDFDKIFNNQIEKENTDSITTATITKDDIENIENINTSEKPLSTLGDLKNIVPGIKFENLWSKFKQVLSETTSEANVVTSLDLTLAKDISETIAHIKETVQTETDETDVNLEVEVTEQITPLENTFVEECDNTENSIPTEESNEEDIVIENKTPVFEQIITMLSKEPKVKQEQSLEITKDATNSSTKNLELNLSQTQTKITEALSKVSVDENVKITDNSTKASPETSIDETMLEELNIESIDSETDTEGQSSLMDNQSPEEQGIKASIQSDIDIPENFDTKLNKISTTQTQNTTNTKPIDVNPSKILEQINKQMDGLQSNSRVNIVLNPESLGKVTIQLIKTGEGLSAQFTVNSQEIKDMLMKGMDGLKDTLLSQGVGVDNISVKVSDTQKSEYNNDWTEQEGSRGGNKEQKESRKEKEEGLFEKMMAQADEKNENGKI